MRKCCGTNHVIRRLLTSRPSRLNGGGVLAPAACRQEFEARRGIVFKIMNPTPHKVTGYYVTFPSIPDETIENNKLLSNIALNEDWPPLTSATPKEFYEGTVRLLMEHGATIREHVELLDKDKSLPRTTETVVDPLLTERYDIDYAFSTLMLKMLTDWPECTQSAFDTDMHHIKLTCARERMEMLTNPSFQEALLKIYDQNEETDQWKNRLLMLYLLEIKAHGHDKHDDQTRKLLGSWSRFLDTYRIKYYMNIILTTDARVFKIPNEKSLADAPPHVKRALAASDDPTNGPWHGKIEPNSIYHILRYCGTRGVRDQAWTTWISRAAFNSDHYNNSINIEELRHNAEGMSRVLGYSSTAEHRLANKMAGTTQTVRRFLTALTRRIRPVFNERMPVWEKYAADTQGITTGIEPYDLFYIARQEAESHSEVNPLELMKHFPFWQTFENLLGILEQLLHLKFENLTHTNLERCHPTVRIYAVSDLTTGEHLGRVYIDPFARPNKRGGWNTLLARPTNESRGLDKLVYVIGDANPPEKIGAHGDVSLLHYSQLEDMLFYIGRAVQLLCARSPYREVTIPQAPMYSADWDAADYFPTFMRFFVYKPSLLATLSCPHVETGAKLGAEAIESVANANARSTLWEAYRTLFWSDYDLTIYEMEDRRHAFWRDLYRRMYKEYFPFRIERNNYQPCSFIPLFGLQSHMAMYYRKLWAEMLALDIHDTFANEKDERTTGERLKSTLLNLGALEPQGDLYRHFMGRDPSVSAVCDFYDPSTAAADAEQKSATGN